MDSSREGGSVNRPPVLDGTNYGYWKARMIAFLKSLDSRTWKAVIHGWEAPMTTDDKGAVLAQDPKRTGPPLKIRRPLVTLVLSMLYLTESIKMFSG